MILIHMNIGELNFMEAKLVVKVATLGGVRVDKMVG